MESSHTYVYIIGKFLAKITSVTPSLQSVWLWGYDPTLLTYCILLGHDTLPLQLQSCKIIVKYIDSGSKRLAL